jgi:hypothetical protein
MNKYDWHSNEKKEDVLKDNTKNCETRYDDMKGEKFSDNERI